jgi:hypothetical protein
VNLGGNRAGLRARTRLGRPQPRGRKFLGEVFQDRKRFPNLHVAILERGHLAGAGHLGDARLEIRGLERDYLFLERNAGDPHGNPWPERPGRIVLVADDELERHPMPWVATRRWWAERRGVVKPDCWSWLLRAQIPSPQKSPSPGNAL